MDNESINRSPKRRLWLWAITAVVAIGVVGFMLLFFAPDKSKTPESETSKTPDTANSKASWKEKSIAISGKYADADVVDIGGGGYRMYYAVEPEVQGNNMEIFSSVSSDGINWTKGIYLATLE